MCGIGSGPEVFSLHMQEQSALSLSVRLVSSIALAKGACAVASVSLWNYAGGVPYIRGGRVTYAVFRLSCCCCCLSGEGSRLWPVRPCLFCSYRVSHQASGVLLQESVWAVVCSFLPAAPETLSNLLQPTVAPTAQLYATGSTLLAEEAQSTKCVLLSSTAAGSVRSALALLLHNVCCCADASVPCVLP